MKTIVSIIIWYLVLVGLLVHLALGAYWYIEPDAALSMLQRAWFAGLPRIPGLAGIDAGRKQLPDHRVFATVSPWVPLPIPADAPPPGMARIGGRLFTSVAAGLAALKPGETLAIGAGTYTTPWVVGVPRVTLVGQGHVVFERGTAQDKANMVVTADDVTVSNIECRLIQVPDRNGACIRQEGRNLTVDHVYYHDSEQGILTVPDPGRVVIRDSRFERLGRDGQAHGIYIGGGELVITASLFLASQEEGHEIKTRAATTTIAHSVIASLNGVDSRLIDAPNGGVLIVTDSVLLEGPNTSNSDVIGFALEPARPQHQVNRVVIRNNLILFDRTLPSRLLRLRDPKVPVEVSGNTIVSVLPTGYEDGNTRFRSRADAGLADYPYLPLHPFTGPSTDR